MILSYTHRNRIFQSPFLFLMMVLMTLVSCSQEDTEDPVQNDQIAVPPECTNVAKYVFNEKDGLVKVQFEEAVFDDLWKLNGDGDAFSGKGYMVWIGPQSLGTPGQGAASFKIKIENTGVYRFLWKSAVKMGNSGSDHNDTWLRFADATDFYAQKGESIVYPKDSGKTPNPEGASKDGWFKIYRSGNDFDFKWQASTFDNNAHDIFVAFDEPGIYTMEISARSAGHGIDQFVLFTESISKNQAIEESRPFSEISCE